MTLGSFRRKLMFLERIVLHEVPVNSCREYAPFFVHLSPVIFAHVATLVAAEGTTFVKKSIAKNNNQENNVHEIK
jgi:hypothetical protein